MDDDDARYPFIVTPYPVPCTRYPFPFANIFSVSVNTRPMKEKSGLGSALRRRIGAPAPPAAQDFQARRESVLMNSTRLKIFQALFNSPCSHVRGLSRAVGVAPPSVLWHLGKMEEKGMVRSREAGRRHVYYPAEMLEEEDVALLSFLGPEKRVAAVRAVTDMPGAPQKELRRLSGANGRTLRALVGRGILDVMKDGRHRRYYPSPLLLRRKEEAERRGRRLRQAMLSRLAQEVLQPEARDTGRGVMEVKVRLGTKTETLRFCRNPYAFSKC